jgi:hypothetical protein
MSQNVAGRILIAVDDQKAPRTVSVSKHTKPDSAKNGRGPMEENRHPTEEE